MTLDYLRKGLSAENKEDGRSDKSLSKRRWKKELKFNILERHSHLENTERLTAREAYNFNVLTYSK